MPFTVELVFVFVLGACIGSFLNVCIYRLPLEKSLVWPGSRCSRCLQPVRWYDNIPLVSYWVLRGRCRTCGQPYSMRYFLVELLTALGLVGLYSLEVSQNIHGLDVRVLGTLRAEVALRVIFAFHAVLFCFLLTATFCDFDHQIIPLPLTVSGTVVGLLGATLFPWPWPYTPVEARTLPEMFLARWPWSNFGSALPTGLYPWPVWGPLPRWLAPGGNWQTGLATGLAGALVGTVVLRAVRLLFGLGMGAEYAEPQAADETEVAQWFGRRWLSWFQRVGGRAMGLGDADLMMMAGSFLGWQPVLVAFFVGVIPGMVFGLAQLATRGGNVMPFGPALALGVVITWLSWRWIGPHYQMLFFNGSFMLMLAAVCGLGLLILSYLLRLMRIMRRGGADG